MSRTTKIVMTGAATLAALFFIATITAAAVIYHEGSVRISVEEKGDGGQHIHLRVPAAIVRAALVLVPESKWDEARVKIRTWGPALEALSVGLAECPDGTLVEVQDRDERVIIAKSRDALVVDVDSSENSVKVSVPFGTMTALVHRLTPGA